MPDQAAGNRHPDFEAVYAELRHLASQFMGEERADHTLQPTALVHEAFAKIAGWDAVKGANRTHLLSLAATAMRHILVDHARKRMADKRQVDGTRVGLTDLVKTENGDIGILELDEIIQQLGELDERKARVVELRVFGGLTIDEVAEALEISTSTVGADWRMARAWLAKELS